MGPRGGLIFAALAIAVFIVSIGYFAWQVENIIRSLDRIATVQEESSQEVKASLARAEGDLRKVRENVGLLSVEEWLRAIEKPLASKVDHTMREAQNRGVEEALQKWSKRLRQREDKRWRSLTDGLRKDREDNRKQRKREEKRWQDVIDTLRKDRETAQAQYQREEERWLNLMETLKKDRETTQKQYREVVQRLSEEKAEALERARQLEEERKREISRLLEQAKQIEQERKRQLSEFCSKRPESTICRDL